MAKRKCCNKCKYYAKLERWIYKPDGVNSEVMDGFLCTAALNDNVGVWVNGIDSIQEWCDTYEERANRNGKNRTC